MRNRKEWNQLAEDERAVARTAMTRSSNGVVLTSLASWCIILIGIMIYHTALSSSSSATERLHPFHAQYYSLAAPSPLQLQDQPRRCQNLHNSNRKPRFRSVLQNPLSDRKEVGHSSHLGSSSSLVLSRLRGGDSSKRNRTDEVYKLACRSSVVVFSDPRCPFCKEALRILSNELGGIDPDVIEVDEEMKDHLALLTNQRSVPNIWIGRNFVGGCQDGPKSWMGLKKLRSNGRLKQMLLDALDEEYEFDESYFR